MSSQADLQITQLRQKILKQKQTIEQQREELDREQQCLIDIGLERDSAIQECQELRLKFKKFETEIGDRKNEDQQQAEKMNHLLKDENDKFKKKIEAKELQNKEQELEIIDLKDQLKTYKSKLKQNETNPQKLDEINNYMNDKEQFRKQLDIERKDLTKLKSDMQNILAENRVLRKLAEVPDHYGFNLEEVKTAENQKIEDFKKQVKYLEREVEELEKERTQLRSRLRTATLLNKNQQGGDRETDEYLRNTERPSYSRNQQDQLVEQLMEKLQGIDRVGGGYGDDQQQGESLEKMKEELKLHMTTLMQNQQSQQSGMQYDDTVYMQPQKGGRQFDLGGGVPQNQVKKSTAFDHHGRPPHYMPGRFGDTGNITEGVTNRFGETPGQGQKIPVDLYDLYSESGFDQVAAKQEIATLQLMNLENIKIIQEKEREYSYLNEELSELKEEYKKMLLIEDNLFEQHYAEIQLLQEDLNKQIEKNDELLQQISSHEIRIKTYEEDLNDLNQHNNPDSLKGKLAEMTRNKAILEVNLIQISRKYACKKEEYDDISEKYLLMDKENSDKEQKYIHRIQYLLDWKKKASTQLKILLKEQKNSIPADSYQTLEEKYNDIQAKYSDQQLKKSDLQTKLAELKGAEREIEEKNDIINSYQEEMVEVNIELEIIKKRLEDKDPIFRQYQSCFKKLVDHCKESNISPLEAFQMYDENKDGQLGLNEFSKVMQQLDPSINPSDLKIVFSFMDLDGNESIEYQEFLRKLRRAGVQIRRKEEEIVFDLYQKITKAGWKVRDLFIALDKNLDNNITKEELGEGLRTVNIQVTKENLDYIFDLADISRDGQINYDEFRSMFTNIISDSIRDDLITSETELDLKKEIILKIDESIREMGYSLIDIYKIIDKDDDQKITLNEFKQLFHKIKVDFPERDITSLFQEIDKDGSTSIQYNELLAYIRAAKKEQAKIERMKKVNQRVDSLREKGGEFDNQIDNETGTEMSMVSRMQMKISMLELREKNANNRIEANKKKLTQQSKEVSLLEIKIEELEAEVIKANKNYYDTREKAAMFQEKVQCCITREESNTLNDYTQKMLIENSDLRAALQTFKALYKASIDQVKVLKLTDEKKNHQMSTLKELQENIKDQQATSDDKALVGKLYHQLMICRWQQGEINKKYDNSLDETQNDKIKIEKYETQVHDMEDDYQDIYQELTQTKRKSEEEIQQLKGKIIPTVSLHRIEELHNKLSEICQQKLDLEITNRKLKEQNNELQLKCDYYESNKTAQDDVIKTLKKEKTDSIEQKVIEQSQQLSELRLSEMKAKREAGVAKEKEEYYQRVNRQHQDTIKTMESEIVQNHQKFNQREEFWRKTVTEAQSLFFKKQEEKEVSKTREQDNLNRLLKNNNNNQNTTSSGKNKRFSTKQINDDGDNVQGEYNEASNQEKEMNIKQLENDLHGTQLQVQDLKDQNRQLQEENQELKQNGGKMLGRQTRQTKNDKHDIEAITQKAIDEESQKFTLAAQKTIQTLHQLIEEKNEQLNNRDRLIKKMQKDFMVEKENDIAEIRKLSNQVVTNNLSTMQKMNASVVQHNGAVLESAEYWGDVGNLLHEKDKNLEQMTQKLNDELKIKKQIQKDLLKEKENSEILREEIQIEKRGNQTNQLKKELDQSRKLWKEKDRELQKIKALIQQLKDDQFKMAEEKYNNKSLMDKVIKEDKSKVQQVQQQLSDALQRVKQSKVEIAKVNDDIEKMRQKEIEQKGVISDLRDENNKLRRGEQVGTSSREDRGSKRMESNQVGSKKDEENIASFLKSDEQKYNTKVKEQTEEIEKLSKENKTLKEQVRIANSTKIEEGLVDKDGNLQGQSMYFRNIKEIMVALNKWQKSTGWNLMENLKKVDNKKLGFIPLKECYRVMKEGGIQLKERDQQIIEQQDELVSNKGNISLVLFYYLLNPSKISKETEKEESQQQQEKSTKRPDSAFKAGSRRDQEESKKEVNSTQLERKLNIVNKQLYEAKKDKDTLEKQLSNWKDKAIRLEKDLSAANQNPRLSSTQKRTSTTQANAIGELKDIIYNMEEQNEVLKVAMYRKDVQIQKLGEERTKLEEDLKLQKLETSKQRSKLENYLGSKVGVEQLRRDNQQEKDVIIRNLKEKLEEQRETDNKLTEKYFEQVQENKELQFIKENFDIQVERLQRRITELEEYKKLHVGPSKDDEPVQQSTLKKGYQLRKK